MAVVAEGGGGAVTTKLLYILVAEDADLSTPSFRYTRSVLQSTLQLMGCKPRHAFKISQRVFEMMRKESEKSVSACPGVTGDVTKNHLKETHNLADACLKKSHSDNSAIEDDKSKSKPFELYKRRTTVVVGRHLFLDVVCEALSEYKYVGPNQRADLVLACRLRERKESVTVLLCGTSGCGKSTLSALLGSRLGITTVVSTDSIRHMMRSFVDEKQNPLLWASTYHAGEYLDPEAVAEAKAKKKAKKSGVSAASAATSDAVINSTTGKSEGISTTTDLISAKQMAVEGYKAQSEMVIESLDRLITSWEERKESVVVEGVHLSLNFVMGLMKKHPSIVPFMIYIANEEKHLERFAVRAKYMTLDPARNKYVKYIRNIRTIQEYLCNRADKHLVPKINNTNVDRSVAAIHATVFSSLRRREAGEQIYDPVTNTVPIVDEEYRNQCSANSLSSKGVFQMIQRQGSTRHLMALLNSDGSVAKAWPLNAVDYSGNPSSGSPPIYGPLRIGKAEPVNLQFGHFGISAWLSDTGCTSHTSSVDESRGEHTDNGSKGFSSSGSSPRLSDGPAKELMEEQSVDGSDEEVDDPPEVDSDEDLSDEEKQHPLQGELEGSVDEESTKSDDEYEDLAMQETPQNAQKTDGGEECTSKVITGEQTNKNSVGEKNKENLDLLRKTKSETFSDSPLKHKNEKRAWLTGKNMFKRRSQSSIPAVGKHESEIIVPTSKEALSTTSATLLSL